MIMVIPSAVEKSPTKQYATTRPWRTIATRHIKDFIKASFLVKGSLLKKRLILSRRCRKGEARNRIQWTQLGQRSNSECCS